MRFKADRIQRERTILRCVWMPARSGANAPLVATWIETPYGAEGSRPGISRGNAEGDCWIFAA